MEDIHQVINTLLVNSANVSVEIQEEVKEIIKDGIITEKEYAQLMKLVRSMN